MKVFMKSLDRKDAKSIMSEVLWILGINCDDHNGILSDE